MRLQLRSRKTGYDGAIARNMLSQDPLFSMLSCKVDAREYIEKKVGKKYCMPVIKVCDDFTSFLEFKPQGEFVIKPSHASGAAILVGENFSTDLNDKSKKKVFRFLTIASGEYPLHADLVSREVQRWLNSDYSCGDTKFPEKVYSRLHRKVLIEPLLHFEKLIVPNDYKLHVYRGKVRFIQVDTNRLGGHERSFFTPSWESLNVTVIFPKIRILIDPPSTLNKMVAIATKLAEGLEMARIDFLMDNSELYVSEISLFPDGGFGKFDLPELKPLLEL